MVFYPFNTMSLKYSYPTKYSAIILSIHYMRLFLRCNTLPVYEILQILLDNIPKLFSSVFWSAMTVTGVMGYAIGLVTVMQVKATSPLTHNISGTAKAAFQVCFVSSFSYYEN